MTNYKSMITPYLDSIRKERTTDKTIRAYTRQIDESIDFLNAGNYEPDEAYYSAFQTHLSENYSESTINSWINLVRKFFDWTLTNEAQLPIIQPERKESMSNEEAPEMHYPDMQEETLQAEAEPTRAENFLPPHEEEQGELLTPVFTPNVDAPHAQEQPLPPQEELGGTASNTLHSGRPRKSDEPRSKKLTIYLTPSLDADVKDLARIQRLSTPDFIFRLIERERDRRADALMTFRALEEN